MESVAFDPLKFANELEQAGFTRKQAEVQAEGIRKVLADRVVTQEYLDLRLREMELQLKYDLTIRLGGIVAACTALLLAALPMLIR